MKFFVVLAICGWTTWVNAAPSGPEPWKIFPWGNGVGQFGLVANMGEVVPEGPTAIAVSGDRIYIADDVNRRIVVLTAQGTISRVITSGKRVASLDANANGAVVLLSAALDQWSLVQPYESIARFQPVESSPTFADGWRAVVYDAALGPVIISSEGGAVALVKGSTIPLKTATPLGMGAHGLARWLTPNSAVVRVWPARVPALSDQSGSVRPKEIVVETSQRLGMARPLRIDNQGRLYVWLETFSNDSPVAVVAEVRRFEPNGVESGKFVWKIDDIAPAYRYVDVDSSGRLYVMASRPAGLALWRLEAEQWESAR